MKKTLLTAKIGGLIYLLRCRLKTPHSRMKSVFNKEFYLSCLAAQRTISRIQTRCGCWYANKIELATSSLCNG